MTNKVLAVFDATNFSNSALEFIMRRNEVVACSVKAFFIAPVTEKTVYDFQLVPDVFMPVAEQISIDMEKVNENIKYFKGYCERHNINYTIYSETANSPLDDLLEETRFSDLMVIGMESFFAKTNKDMHDEYMHRMLHAAECPILLIPDDYYIPADIFLTYDGSSSSMYAIKQFCYLLPEMHKRNITLLHAGLDKDIPNVNKAADYLKNYFPNMEIEHLQIEASKYFGTWINDKQYAMVVAGAYGRNSVSEAFKSSFVSEVVEAHKVPIFIAHK